MEILITGATGFIGEPVVKKLLNEKIDIRLFVRDLNKVNDHVKNNVKICKGDLTNKKSVYDAVAGCNIVLHLGAVATGWESNPQIYFDVNYSGTKNLFDACLKNHVRKIVYTSTSLSPFQKVQSEKDDSNLPDYVKSKILSEQLADFYLEKGLDINIVYPTRVFGPGPMNDANSATRVIDMYLKNKFPFIIRKGMNVANWVYVEDVAQGIILTMHKGKTGKRYILGGENINDENLYNLLDEISGKKHLRIYLPYLLALGFATGFSILSSVFSVKPLIIPGWLKALCDNNYVSIDETVADLGYSVTPLLNSLKHTVDWLNTKNRSY